MAIDNIARGIASTKVGKEGGQIDGNLHIVGDLTVDGMMKTTEKETLFVEDVLIVTNSEGVALDTYSGIAIKAGPTKVYGIVYDPEDNTVKLGLGSLDSQNIFHFEQDKGKPIAIRADSDMFEDGHYVKWDSSANMLVDGGTGVDLSNYVKNTIFGVRDGDSFDINTKMYVNTDTPISFIDDFLSKIALTLKIKLEDGELVICDPDEPGTPIGAFLFDGDEGSEGVYMVDVDKLGQFVGLPEGTGSGYYIFSAIITEDGISYTHKLYLSEANGTNKSILDNFIPGFTLPSHDGWYSSEDLDRGYFELSSNVGNVVNLRYQTANILTKYSKYISGLFTTDRRMWDSIQFMMSYM